MHISRIEVRNFRNFESLELTDLQPTVVFVGENATGKSNLFEALRLVLDPAMPETARRLVAEDFWDGLAAPFGGDEIRIEVDIAGFQEDQRAKALLQDYFVSRDPHVARLKYVFRRRTVPARDSDYEFVLLGGTDDARRLRWDAWRYVSIRVLPALRDAAGDLLNARSPLRRLLARVDVPPDRLGAVAAAIDQANETMLADPGITATNTAIGNRLQAMIGAAFSVATTLGFVAAQPEQLLRAVRLFVDDTKRRSLDQASLGTANLIYLALLIEHVSAQEADQDTVATFLAVEEPEAHLHPHVQRYLFRQLVRGTRPVMVSTHSPHIASVTPLDALVLLRTSHGKTQAFRAHGIDLSDTQRADLERYMDVTRAEMLFAKGVILVEGVAEQYVIPALAAATGFDLDAHGITVCSVQGTDFLPYQRLLGESGLNIPHVVVTDGDPDAAGLPVGLSRPREITVDDAGIAAAIAQQDFIHARKLLAQNNVFVGETTIEIDLIAIAHAAMLQAFNELVPSPVSRQHFVDSLLAATGGDVEARKRVLVAIERIGKGRYAQRLAPHLTADHIPEYIGKSLERIREAAVAG